MDFSYRSKSLGTKHKHCRKCVRESGRKWYLLNTEKHIINNSLWDSNNVSRKKAIKREHTSRIRAKEICSCCTRKEFLTYYENCPEGSHVDHIKRLSRDGIHCIKNLQYLTASEHGKKSCRERWHENTDS